MHKLWHLFWCCEYQYLQLHIHQGHLCVFPEAASISSWTGCLVHCQEKADCLDLVKHQERSKDTQRWQLLETHRVILRIGIAVARLKALLAVLIILHMAKTNTNRIFDDPSSIKQRLIFLYKSKLNFWFPSSRLPKPFCLALLVTHFIPAIKSWSSLSNSSVHLCLYILNNLNKDVFLFFHIFWLERHPVTCWVRLPRYLAQAVTVSKWNLIGFIKVEEIPCSRKALITTHVLFKWRVISSINLVSFWLYGYQGEWFHGWSWSNSILEDNIKVWFCIESPGHHDIQI